MGDTIKFKRGLKSRLPQLNLAEPALVLDEKRLYIGGQEGNIPVPNQQDIEEINSQLAHKASQEQVDKISEKLKKTDLLETVRNNNINAHRIFAQIIGDRALKVGVPINNGRLGVYQFEKDANDDHIKITSCGVGVIRELKMWDSITGDFTTSAAPNCFAKTVGASFEFTFVGTGFDFQHFSDDRGGVWEFLVDGKTIQISTHIDAVPENEFIRGVTARRNVIRNLPYGEYTVTATFMGDDPEHPPSSGEGNSRGWVNWVEETKNDYDYTIIVYGVNEGDIGNEFEMLQYNSNKEFAFSVRPSGTSFDYHWLPEHNNTPTVFADEQIIKFDGVPVLDFTEESKASSYESVVIYQKSKGVHPNDPDNPLVEIITVYTITNKGVTVNYKFKFLRDTDIASGYTMQMPVSLKFPGKILLDDGQEFTQKTGSSNISQNFDNPEDITSFAVLLSGDEREDYVATYKLLDINETMRNGKNGYGGITALYRGSDKLHKLYPTPYYNTTVQAGEEYISKAEMYIGHLQKADEFI